MENEKLRILRMLENRQISATEAAELLKAIDGGGKASPPGLHSSSHTSHPSPSHTTNQSSYPSTPASETKYTDYTPNTGRTKGGSSFNLDELGRKFDNFAKDMAPKVQRFTEVVADKISTAADRVSEAFSDGREHTYTDRRTMHPDAMPSMGPQSTARPATPYAKPAAPSGGVQQINTELLVERGAMNELDLSALGGDIRLKGYNGDKITARISYKSMSPRAAIELVRLGGRYFLKYDPDDFSSVSIDAYIPERVFNLIKLDGTNSGVDLSSISSGQIRISNMNGTTSLSSLTADSIVAESSGGAFKLSNIVCESGKFENLNGPVEASEIDVRELKLSNYNNQLQLMVSKFDRYTDYIWSVETGNARLGINLPTLSTVGYHIKAHAAMSEIRLGLTGLQFLVNEPSLVEARSVNFDRFPKRVKIAVETSNAPLTIN